MKKSFKIYAICWAILLAVFNVICFVTPNTQKIYETEYVKFGGAFWTGYIFITLAFIGQLICAFLAFRAENLQKMFYSLSLVTVSYTGLILTIIFGALCMAIPDLPNWVGIIVCLLILAFNAIAVIKASAAAEIVGKTDEKVKAQTAFIKEMTAEAQNLTNRANAPKLKEYCKKVYEALRFSDPISDEQLADIETRIKEEFATFTDAVISEDSDLTKSSGTELLNLINERNGKCKSLK